MSFRVASWPSSSDANPYRDLYHRALSKAGVQIECDCRVNDDWLRAHSGEIDAIHLHWPEPLWRERQGGRAASLRGLVGLVRYLRLAAALGVKRIWTMHNLEDHEGATWVDRLGYRTLASESDLILCHSKLAAVTLRRTYRVRGSVVVMAHGNYDGVYPSPRPRPGVLAAFGLHPDLPLFVSVGNLRDYKGLELVADAANRLGSRAQFLIAGRPHVSFDIEPLRDAARRLDNLGLVERQLSNQDFADVVSASEAVILPYRKVTGSGALLAAWTLRRPVIGSDLEYFREIAAGKPAAARFFPTGDAAGLERAIDAFLAEDPVNARESSRQLSDYFAWDRCIEPVAAVIEQWQTERVAR